MSDSIRDMQVKLRQLGLYAGTIDGDARSIPANAITAFQAQAGLPQTGEMDPDTSWRLLEDVRTMPNDLGEDDG